MAEIRPRFSFKRKEVRMGEFEVIKLDLPGTTDSHKSYWQRAIVADIKEIVCCVPDTAFDDTSYANIPTTPYELPIGQYIFNVAETIEVGADRFKIPDIMFNPTLIQYLCFKPHSEGGRCMRVDTDDPRDGEIWYGVWYAIQWTSSNGEVIESINKCDPDIRRELFSV